MKTLEIKLRYWPTLFYSWENKHNSIKSRFYIFRIVKMFKVKILNIKLKVSSKVNKLIKIEALNNS